MRNVYFDTLSLSGICDDWLPYTFNRLKNEEVGAGLQPERESVGGEIWTPAIKKLVP